MKSKINIKDIHSLRMAKAELTAEVAHREVNMRIKAQELKDSFFDFSKMKEKGTESILNFLGNNFNMSASAISNFVIKYLIRPKKKWVRRLSMAASNLLINKYSKVLKAAFSVLLDTKDNKSIQ